MFSNLKFRSTAVLFIVILYLATFFVTTSAAATSGDRSFTASYDGSTRYFWLDLPDDFNSSASTPLVIFLHGYGQDRSCYRTYYPGLQLAFHQNGWMVACPECRWINSGGNSYQTWYTAPSRSDITDVINLLEQEFNINRNHIHVVGTSMGGSGTLKYAMFNPNIIASALDVMGVTNFTEFYYWTPNSDLHNSIAAAYGGTPTTKPQVYKDESPLGNEIRFMHTPVFLLHGSADTVVPVSNSRNLNNSLSQAGYVVKYDEIPGVGHYGTDLINGREQEIFEWFRDHPLYTTVSPSTTITSIPAGTGFVIVDGVAVTTPRIFKWAVGEHHNLTASSLVSGTGVQYVYSGWSDGGGQTHDYTVQSSSNTVTATYKTQWQVTFTVNPTGAGTTSPTGSGLWEESGPLSILATPTNGYSFSSWSTSTGSITLTSASSASTSATISGPGTITANFASATGTVSVVITSSPSGAGFVKVDGTAIATPQTFTWTEGSTHTLQANSPVPGGSGVQYIYTGWSDTGGQTHNYTVQSTSNTVTATFKTQYQLTVTSAYGTPLGVGWYDNGKAASFSVTSPAVGSSGTRYVCTGYSGDASGSGTSGTVTMNGPKKITFAWKTQYKLTVKISPFWLSTTNIGVSPASAPTSNGWGSVYYWFDSSTTVTLTAKAISGYKFSKWSGAASVTLATATVKMSGPMTVTATYTR